MNPNHAIETLRKNTDRDEDRVIECTEADGTTVTIGHVPSRDAGEELWVRHTEGMNQAHVTGVDAVESAIVRCSPDVEIKRYGESVFQELRANDKGE